MAWSVRALEAGKHVLCEKPLTRRPAEVEEAFDAAERAGRVLAEAFMWRHHPQTHRLRELLDEGAIGTLRMVNASFSFPLADAERHPPAGRPRRRLADGRRLLLRQRLPARGRRRARARVRRAGRSAATASTSRSRRRCASPATCSRTSTAASLSGAGTTSRRSARRARCSSPTRGTARSPVIELRREDGVERIEIDAANPYALELVDFARAVRGEAPLLLGRADALGQARAIEALYTSAESGSAAVL